MDWLVDVHGFKSLSTSNLWHDRPVRGGTVPSSHRGAAFDARYEYPGPGRPYMLNDVLPVLITQSFEFNVQQIHDYVGCRVWKASRSSDSAGGWARQNPGSHSGMMGADWAQWLHVEAGEWAWNDGRPIPDKLGGTPPLEVHDMAAPASVIDGNGDGWVFFKGRDGALWYQYAGNKAATLGGQVTDAINAVTSGDVINVHAYAPDGDLYLWQFRGTEITVERSLVQ